MFRNILVCILGLMVFATPAAAREAAYFAVGLAQSQTEANGATYSGVSYSVLLGAQFSPNLAVEAEYTDHGELSDDKNNKISASSKGIALLLLQPLSRRASVYAKIEAAQVSSIMSGTTVSGISNSLSTMPYGVGLQYEATRNTTLRLFAETGYNYQVNGSTTGTVTATNYSFGGSIYRVGLSSLYTF